MTSEFYPPNDPLEKEHWKTVKLGDAASSLKFLFPKLSRRLRKRMLIARDNFRRMLDEQEQEADRRKLEKRNKNKVAGYVYLIRAENGLYKIGKAKDVSKRMKPFSVNFPMKWELVHNFWCEDYTTIEALLHHKFADKRDVGEWFRLQPDDVTYVLNIQDGQL